MRPKCSVIKQRAAGWYGRAVGNVLVLWDIDYTLINAGGSSTQLYGMVFRTLFGRELHRVAPMAGRTDRAIILHTLERAGVSDPYEHVEAFLAGLADQAPGFRALVAERGHALPGAAAALDGLGRRTPCSRWSPGTSGRSPRPSWARSG